jgi:hypothetical protein
MLDNIIYGDDPEFETIEKETAIGQGRWYTYWTMIVKYKPTGHFYQVKYNKGSTEMQDEGPMDITIDQCWPQEVTRTIYTTKREN